MAKKSRKEMAPEELRAAREDDNRRKRESRGQKRVEKEITEAEKILSGERVSQTWERYSNLLRKEEPVLHAKLEARHEEVEMLEAEAEEVIAGVENNLRALREDETRNPKSTDVFANPSLCFRDYAKDIAENGTYFYGAWDRRPDFRPTPGARYRDLEQFEYRACGFRLQLNPWVYKYLAQAVVLCGLRCPGTVDKDVLDDAIRVYESSQFHHAEADKLVRAYKGLQPLESDVLVTASDGYSAVLTKSEAQKYLSGERFYSPDQLQALASGRTIIERPSSPYFGLEGPMLTTRIIEDSK